MIADGLFFCPLPHRVLGVILFEVCMLCFIVTFHVITFDKGCRLNTSVFCSPQAAQMHTFQSTSETTFRFLSGLEHAMIFVCWETDTVHKSICPRCCHWHTQPAWPTELAANIEWVVIVMLLLQLLIGPLDWTRKIETTSNRKKIYSTKSRNNENSLGSWFN